MTLDTSQTPGTPPTPVAPAAPATPANGSGLDFSQAPRQRPSDEIDFAAINQKVLETLPLLLQRWLPGGKLEGAEYVVRNPLRDDNSPGSFKINLKTGKWADFADGDEKIKGGDAISFFAYLGNRSQQEAAIWLSLEVKGLPQAEVEDAAVRMNGAKASSNKKPIMPVPNDAPPLNFRLQEHGSPHKSWPYQDADGRLVGYACRWDIDDENGNRNKLSLPVTYCEMPDGKRAWRSKSIPAPRPLYRLPDILRRDNDVIAVNEGEKATDACQLLFSQWVATTSAQGSKAAHQSDWSAVNDQYVVISPDRDKAGQDYLRKVADLCYAAGAKEVAELQFPAHLMVRDGQIVQREGEVPEGWDLADALDDGWTPELVRKVYEEGIVSFVLIDPPDKAEEAAPAADGTGAEYEWPEPMDLLSQKAEPAPSFPMEFLPGAFRRFVTDVAKRLQCPPDYVAIPLLASAGTAVGRDFKLAPKANDNWSERPCLWGGIVGPPGTLKTPAFNAATDMLRRIQAQMKREHDEAKLAAANSIACADLAERAWKEDYKKAVKARQTVPEKPKEAEKPVKPVLQRVLVGDTTLEKLIDVISENPRGVMLCRDEMSSIFLNFNQYRKGSDEKVYLQFHAGSSDIVERKGSGEKFIDEPFLSICGGIQPEALRKVLSERERDGLAARFSLMVYPELNKTFEYVDCQPDYEAISAADKIMRDLFELRLKDIFGELNFDRNPVLRFDKEAQQVFVEWYTRNQTRLRAGEFEPAMQDHVAKYPGLFARLAIVHHLIRVVEGNTARSALVDVETARAVAAFIDDYLEGHARRIYECFGQDPAREGARRIAEWIVSDLDTPRFTTRDIRRKNWSRLTTQEDVNLALDYLTNVAGWLHCDTDLPGPKGGRPTTRYQVNPKVRGG